MKALMKLMCWMPLRGGSFRSMGSGFSDCLRLEKSWDEGLLAGERNRLGRGYA